MPHLPNAHKLERQARTIVESLAGTWRRDKGMCCCPAHDDRTPSLSVTLGRKAILFHCFAGCSNEADMAALERMPGVGHKTASVVMAQAFGVPAFPVDTHIHRLAWRWTLSTGKSVEQTEADLKKLFPEDSWNDLHIRIIYFGREHCPAKGHDPRKCPICSVIGRKELFKG